MTDDEKRAALKNRLREHPEDAVAIIYEWRDENLGLDNLDAQHAVERRAHAKRRTLGFNPLNSPFDDCEGHHINHDDVIYIPKILHKSVKHNQWAGKGMEKINALARLYL